MATSCEFESMAYVDEDSIDPNLICSICHRPLKDPVCTPCDHTYGRGCITHWLTSNVVYSCPTCAKQPLLIKDLAQASRPLRNILDQIRVRCTLCEETGLQRGNFLDHINMVCPKAMVQCQAADIKCPWKGPRDELDNHAPACIFEPLRPVLAILIADNQQLVNQVRKHDDEIKKLREQMSQMNNVAADNSDDESDISSVSEFAVGGTSEMEEDAIFIRNLPGNIKFNDLFDFFTKIGRIKYNPTARKVEVFIFKNPNNKYGQCTAKVVFENKNSANTAVAEYDGKHIAQWNTRIRVSISNSKRKNMKDVGKYNNEGNTGVDQEAKGFGDCEKTPNLIDIDDQSQIPSEKDQAGAKTNTRPRLRQSKPGGKPTSKN